MLSISRPLDSASFPPGQRPGIPLLASAAPSRPWEAKGAESAASARVHQAYPSPPMSGSPPPPPPRTSREASERAEAPPLYLTAIPQDAYRERPMPLPPTLARQQLPPPAPLSRPYPPEPPRAPYGFPTPEELMPQTPLYSPRQPRGVHQAAYQRQHAVSAGPSSDAVYPMASRAPALENQSFTSPQAQRITKGHVASACVPCKRAHLRCDAQRPCSRCLSNGKEDACIDVQHKKRGRPRLRDDRDTRYDPLRLPHYPDASLRRPLNVYQPGGPGARGFEDPRQRQHRPYRPLETAHRQFERGPDASVYSSSPLAAGYPEPVAYLTMAMEFAKASPTFLDAIGAASVSGRKLGDVAASSEADKIFGIQSQLVGEQKQREPNYLPPILGLGGQAFQGMGFSIEDISRFPLNIQEQLTFVGSDGYARQHAFRMGLGKEGSFFFFVMLLRLPPRFPPPPSSPYHGAPSPHASYAPRAPAAPAFDPVRHRVDEGPARLRPPQGLQSQPGPAPSLARAGASATSPYHTSTIRPPRQPAHDAVWSESCSSAGRPGPPRFQLPPIRAQSEHRPSPGPQPWQRDERSSRVNIEGLIDKPGGPGRPQ